MKLLVGAACVAVIAFVGYFFWGEYASSQAVNRQAFKASCDQLLTEGATRDVSTLTDTEKVRIRKQIADCIAFIRDGRLP